MKLDLDKGGFIGDTAQVAAFSDVDVTLHTPVGVPGVAHNPVLGSAREVIANELHAVIELTVVLGAVGLQDATRVVHPGLSIDADRDRASGSKVGGELGLVLFGAASMQGFTA